LKVDFGRSSKGFLTLGSSGTRGSSSSSSASLALGFFSALGAGGGAGLGSFFSFAGGVNWIAFSVYMISPKIGFSFG